MTLAAAPAGERSALRIVGRLDGLALFAVALAVNALASRFISQPGYTDAYYYFDGARQLASGQGFSEPYLWNYLAPLRALDPGHTLWPSHLYWMPLVSLLATPFLAAARQLAGDSVSNAALFRAAQLPFLLCASVLPLLSYGVTELVGGARRQAIAAGLLTLFSPFYFVFWTTSDGFALYALLAAGALVLTTLAMQRPVQAKGWLFGAGLAAGLAHLTRADGVLLVMCLALWLVARPVRRPGWRPRLLSVALLLAGYGAIMLPWFWRNWVVAGAPLGLGGIRTLWLTSYDDLFTFAPARLSAATYLAAGAGTILSGKWSAFLANAQTIIAVQCGIVAFPFVLIGLWRLRHNSLIQLALLYGVTLLMAMTLVFTFPGARGGYFHSGAALLPFFMASATVGLDVGVETVALRLRHWQPEVSKPIFSGLLVGFALLLTVFVFWKRVIGSDFRQPIWQANAQIYADAGAWLIADGQDQVMVAVNDPPGWNYWTRWPAIVIPNGDAATLRQAMLTYGARFLVLDSNRPAALAGLYANPRGLSTFLLQTSFTDSVGQPVYLLELAPEP